MNAGDICNREVEVIEATESVVVAARIMRESHVGSLVVIEERADGRYPRAIITDRDIVVTVVAQSPEHIADVTVGEMASGPLVTAREDEPISKVLARMREHGIRRLPIVDTSSRLIGILAVDDLIEHIGDQLDDIIRLIFHEQRRERFVRR